MESGYVEVDYHGVRVIGPESFFCAVLVWNEQSRVLPVWLSPIDGAELAERTLEDSSGRRRPTPHDVLADVLSRYDGGVERLALTSYYEGVFIGEIRTASGEDIDARASDVLILSQILGLPIDVDEDVLNQAALHIAPEELEEYLDLDIGDAAEVGEGAHGIDEEFQEMLRDLDSDNSDDSDDADDDNGDEKA
ncbi:bifunctional nuclease family protein [Corynebacterium yudongzhengii]|uniref:Bifunctional nuclease family protein n=1 Tax=Corynebacterium yudongzhengii TaxID=2080740 RepID=A0A2U1T8J8_9CORY|nr:bifunctional nuclease domain-containing protein [Corynebacterium yudongzhengii]AWB81934.1 bifunctional nuclease family protein [Corynebacterium yudongzhengii]PWC02326.1 bifunctional nuclease family protein [Corynebacterium yudongzhengii]